MNGRFSSSVLVAVIYTEHCGSPFEHALVQKIFKIFGLGLYWDNGLLIHFSLLEQNHSWPIEVKCQAMITTTC